MSQRRRALGLLLKLADGDEGQGAPAHRTAVYKEALEDATTGVTLLFMISSRVFKKVYLDLRALCVHAAQSHHVSLSAASTLL